MTNKTILVSGGAGYIGSHTCYSLSQAGYTPVALDDFSSGHEWAAKFGPVRRGNIGDVDFVKAACEEFKPAALLHFAAFIEVADSVKYPEKFWDNNVARAKTLFNTAAAQGVDKIVFSSTAAVYGMVGQGALDENTPLKPINPYGATKLAAEEYLRTMPAVRSVCLRYFNAAGAAAAEVGIGEAHWPETHLVPNVILAALGQKEKLTVFGTDYPTRDGTAVRDYIHVLDLAAAHVKAVDYLLAGNASAICNLGSGDGYSIQEIITKTEAHFSKSLPVEYGPRREGDPATLLANPAQAEKILGWRPQRGLDEIIISAATWHQSQRYQQSVAARQQASPPSG
jgi:UDP-glucose-4-epimerase GalE